MLDALAISTSFRSTFTRPARPIHFIILVLPTRHRLADRLGGKPEDHRRLTLAIAALSHGTATLLLIPGVQESVVRELRQTCLMAAEQGITIEAIKSRYTGEAFGPTGNQRASTHFERIYQHLSGQGEPVIGEP